MKYWLYVFPIALLLHHSMLAAEEEIDASDPTKIYTYAGGGIKYTDYTNDESMTELRATGNIGVSPKDMGWHSGDLVPGSNSGLANARVSEIFPIWCTSST